MSPTLTVQRTTTLQAPPPIAPAAPAPAPASDLPPTVPLQEGELVWRQGRAHLTTAALRRIATDRVAASDAIHAECGVSWRNLAWLMAEGGLLEW